MQCSLHSRSSPSENIRYSAIPHARWSNDGHQQVQPFIAPARAVRSRFLRTETIFAFPPMLTRNEFYLTPYRLDQSRNCFTKSSLSPIHLRAAGLPVEVR